jgi:hypothetical protein
MTEPFRPRCYLVYARAPESVSASRANDALNSYIEDRSRGIAVFHDHFTVSPHGGFAVFEVRSEHELARLDKATGLVGWEVRVHPLTFSLSAVGFNEQMHLTVHEYARTSLDALREAEPDDPRFWWQQRPDEGGHGRPASDRS